MNKIRIVSAVKETLSILEKEKVALVDVYRGKSNEINIKIYEYPPGASHENFDFYRNQGKLNLMAYSYEWGKLPCQFLRKLLLDLSYDYRRGIDKLEHTPYHFKLWKNTAKLLFFLHEHFLEIRNEGI